MVLAHAAVAIEAIVVVVVLAYHWFPLLGGAPTCSTEHCLLAKQHASKRRE